MHRIFNNSRIGALMQSPYSEEVEDVLEVLQAICVARGYSLDEIEKLRAEKAEKRGGNYS